MANAMSKPRREVKEALDGRIKPAEEKAVEHIEHEIKRVRLVIEGLPPGVIFQGKELMDYNEKRKAKAGGKRDLPQLPPEKEAELRAHWKGKGRARELAIPSVMFYRSFTQASLQFQDPAYKKASMASKIGATIAFEEDMIRLGKSCKYEVKMDWVRIPPRTGAFVKIGRPLITKWKVDTIMSVDDELYDINGLEEIIIHAGKVVGIGANSPRLRGPYGKFRLLKFEILG